MTRNETTILAEMSTTQAAIATLLGGVGAAGDYRIGEKQVNRAMLLRELQARMTALREELDAVPSMAISTVDVENVSQLGAVDIEYVSDTAYD